MKVRSFYSFVFFLSFFLQLNGQSISPFDSGAANIALGNTTTTAKGINSLFGNQAGFAKTENFEFIVNSANYYLLNELNQIGIGAILPTKSGNFGFVVSQFGIDEYSEQKFGLAYARKIGKLIQLGVQFDYFNFKTDEFGNNGTVTVEAGLQASLSENWVFGVHLFSPAKIQITPNQSIPTIFKIGFAYSPSKKVLFRGELEKDISFPIRFNGGVQYELNERLYARVGVRLNPTNFNFGIGTNLMKKFHLDVSFSYHQVLGFSPLLSVIYRGN